MLLGGQLVVGMLQTFRVAWISGRYGGGKTALAYRLAYELLNSGFSRYLLSNCRSVWRDDPRDVVLRDGRYLDAVVVLDEAGLFLRTSRDADDFLAFLRKLNVVLILPSVKPPAPVMRMLTIQRVANLSAIGLPVWVYEVSVDYARQRGRERFAWINPSEVFGIYDTTDVPVDDCGIGDYLYSHVAELVERAGHGRSKRFKRVLEVESGGGQSGIEAFDSAAISDAVEQFTSAVSLLAGGHERKRRR